MFLFRNLTSLVFCFTMLGCASMGSGTKSEKRQEILNMKDAVLTQLFTKKPDTRSQINSAPGYAVLSNANIN